MTDIPAMSKVCDKCGIVKKLTEFKKVSFYYRKTCIECLRKIRLEHATYTGVRYACLIHKMTWNELSKFMELLNKSYSVRDVADLIGFISKGCINGLIKTKKIVQTNEGQWFINDKYADYLMKKFPDHIEELKAMLIKVDTDAANSATDNTTNDQSNSATISATISTTDNTTNNQSTDNVNIIRVN